mgnify:CR=1 FL=1
MKNFYKIIFSIILLSLSQYSFSQRLQIVTSTKAIELGNNEMEIAVVVTNFDSVAAITLRYKIDTTKLKYQSFSYINPSIQLGVVTNFAPSVQSAILLWVSSTPFISIGNDTLFKVKFKRIECLSQITFNVLNGNCEYANEVGDVLTDVVFTNGADNDPTCVVGLNNIQTNPSILTAVSFPNPNFGEKLTINYKANKNGNINAQLYNSQGKLVYKIENQISESNGTLNFNLQNLVKGIYYYNVNLVNSDQTYRFTDKIVIE